jgi:hypothetical protein
VLTVEDVDRREDGKDSKQGRRRLFKELEPREEGRVVCIRPTRIARIANGGLAKLDKQEMWEKRVSEEGKTKKDQDQRSRIKVQGSKFKVQERGVEASCPLWFQLKTMTSDESREREMSALY